MSRHLVIVLSLSLVAGCALYHPKPVSPAQTAAQWEARRLDDPGLKKFLEQNLGHELRVWPLKAWDLPTLTLAAFYFQPGIEVARAQWQVADAAVKTAGERPNPTLSLTPGYDTTTAIPSPWFPGANLDLPVETMGKRGKRVAAARHAAESARFDFMTAAWKARRDLRANLLDATVAGHRAGLLEKQFAAQQQVVKLLQQRFDAGEISRPELTTAQIALNKTQLDFSDARANAADAQSQLAQSIGVSVAALDGLDLEFDFSQTAANDLTSADARHTALLSRTDILGALADYAAAEDGLRLEIAKQYPDLHLGPGYQYDQGDNKWSLGVTLELPVLNHNGGPVAEARATRALAAAKFVELQSQAIAEIDRAVAGYRVAQEQLQTADALFKAAQQQQQFAAAQWQAGAADALDAQSAELEFDNASLAQLDNEAKFQASLGALEDALQRPADTIAATIQKISQGTKSISKHEP